MSINVTVTGNPISIRHGKMVLSDLENIRKSEREHRKRLRLEQVNEQSRAFSKKILERARQIEKEQLERIAKNENTQMRREHEKRLLEIHRRYQELENIGYAHSNAISQPDIESMKKVQEQKNRARAKSRGVNAQQQQQEINKVLSAKTKQMEKLMEVRNLENQRSQMVAQLPKKQSCTNSPDDSSENENAAKFTSGTPSKSKLKNKALIKSPIRKSSHRSKDPSCHTRTSHISVSVNNEDIDHIPTTITSCMKKSKMNSTSKCTNVPKIVSDTVQELNKGHVCQSDDNEPRKFIPVTSTVSSKPEKLLRYNIESYQDTSSEISTTSATSSLSSDDSPYFSDNTSKVTTDQKTPRHHTSPVSSKISLYDYKTRHQNTYNRPSGLVERINIKNKPNADEFAQEITQLEKNESSLLANCTGNQMQRNQNALLEEKIKRKYQIFLTRLDQLNKEKQKLEASLINQQVPAPSKNKIDIEKRQKKMDRALEKILRNSREPENSHNDIERPITITPRDYIHSNPTPRSAWKEPPYYDGKESDESYSDKEGNLACKRKISELLVKIESLHRILLQECGTDLPDNIFNVSLRSLFNQTSTSTSQEKVTQSVPKSTSPPEIEVINMSSCNEIAKPVRKFTCKGQKTLNNQVSEKNPPKSADKNTITTRDQEIQVELKGDKIDNEVIKCPLEPIVKIINPETANCSSSICNSDSSTASDLVITIMKPNDRESSFKISTDASKASPFKSSKQSTIKTPVKISFKRDSGPGTFEVLIDPDRKGRKEMTSLRSKRKKAVESPFRKSSTVESKKSQSLPGSRVTSPSKKQSKSAPPSQQSSPKKSQLQSRPTKSFEKQDSTTQEKRYRTQITQISIDSSTESSQLNSASEKGNTKFYSRIHTLASSRLISQLQDTSDTSTTYASPPTAVAGTLLNAVNSSTSILELLDSSSNETIKRKMSEVSPVSSPETPSPRTMMIPSNIPRSNLIKKSLKFTSLINAQGKSDHDNVSKSTKPSFSVSEDKATNMNPTRQERQMHPCTCKNPDCKLFHDKIENTQDYALKHCPKILKKYDDLQKICTKRIASLSDLIEKVRNEKGLDLSVMTNEDSAVHSVNQAHQISQTLAYDTSSMLVKNVESIRDQVKKTLLESQKFISGEGLDLPGLPVPYRNIEKSPSISIDLSKNTSTSESLDENADKIKYVTPTTSIGKPKILKNERVNIRLDRYIRRNAGGGDNCKATETAMVTSSTSTREPNQGEHMVKMLQNEILEQSKSINKSVPVDNLKNSDDPLLKLSQAPVKDMVESNRNGVVDVQTNDNNQLGNLETSNSDFIPLLAGIPKIPRSLTKGSSNGRGRPPVTLVSGPYRPEIISPAHELSTIIEFDTPTTANKSQLSTRSPSNRARKKLPVGATVPSVISSPMKKSDIKLLKCKPSVHVAPLPVHQSPQLNMSTSKNIEKSPPKSMEISSKGEFKKSHLSFDSMLTLPDMHIEHLHQSQDNTDGNLDFRISQISELESLPDENIDQLLISELYEETKSKSATPSQIQNLGKEQKHNKSQLSLSSSTSFSGLSGVSEIKTTPSSDLNNFQCPSSPEEMELALKKWGLSWAIPVLKKTREASALGSSSSSDVTPINTVTKHVSPVKKLQEITAHNFPEISDVSSISIKHANKSTERSVLVKGRTSTPNQFSNSNSEETISTLGSFSAELNIVVPNQSADMTITNISFSNTLT